MKQGDFITGVDRRYPRSIYQLHRLYPAGRFQIKFISLMGFKVDIASEDGVHPPQPPEDLEAFRLATPEEIADSAREWTEAEREAYRKSLPGRPFKMRYKKMLDGKDEEGKPSFIGHCLVEICHDDEPGFENFGGELVNGNEGSSL
jgi:hypothetical protein